MSSNTFEDVEEEIIAVLVDRLKRSFSRPDGPFNGSADIAEIDEVREVITGTVNYGRLAQEVLAMSLWLFSDHHDFMGYLDQALTTAKEELLK